MSVVNTYAGSRTAMGRLFVTGVSINDVSVRETNGDFCTGRTVPTFQCRVGDGYDGGGQRSFRTPHPLPVRRVFTGPSVTRWSDGRTPVSFFARPSYTKPGWPDGKPLTTIGPVQKSAAVFRTPDEFREIDGTDERAE